MKKTIGVYADAFNGKVGQTFAYMQFLSQFGFVRLLSTTDNLSNVVNEIDMLVVPGGADVDVAMYNAVPGVMDGRVNQHYEYLDRTLIPQFIEAKKPIVGICRGMQALNVYFGGTLIQHVIGHQQDSERHVTKQELQFYNSEDIIFVNSMHHQAVGVLGVGFDIVGYTRSYSACYSGNKNLYPWRIYEKGSLKERIEVPGIIEVIKHRELPIVGFQYHPEEFNCQYAVDEINKLLNK
jgi:gamma-glutamyl-gamma-aminobutyrate hydrolase PuuD